MTELLAGRIALVTGSTSNIGLATARELAAHGALVVVHGRDPARAEPVAAELDGDVVTGDLANLDEIDAMFEQIGRRHGRLDILVNSAATTSRTHLLELELEEWTRAMAINATAVLRTIQQAVPLMPDGGAIVNITTSLVPQPAIGRGAYAASKAAMDALTRQAALDLAGRGIRVNAVVSGQVGSPVGQRELGRRSTSTPTIPLGRIGRPEEIASVVRFLASDDASYLTNSFVTVDGGRMHAAAVDGFPGPRVGGSHANSSSPTGRAGSGR
ncbi:SDR family NAD(P)-dependent oxidoreductase [Egicoccus halophilus]|uniref:Oxidoreductase n=1 Tax=Egicoccus halophilus TaxID=1670830 RepID=A0A8J3A7B2_9ACTN|nr:SDR family oxidoreductase [Egicoccus halophilus]GGI02433.1 oxidoreductase [Egicoccus halophilus]